MPGDPPHSGRDVGVSPAASWGEGHRPGVALLTYVSGFSYATFGYVGANTLRDGGYLDVCAGGSRSPRHAIRTTGPSPTIVFPTMSSSNRSTSGRSAFRPDRGRQAAMSARDPRPSFDVVVMGGGEGGMAVLNNLKDRTPLLKTALLDPDPYHYDQPDWINVATEGADKEETRSHKMFELPPGTVWIRDSVTKIRAEESVLETGSSGEVGYGNLVIATGVETRWDRIRNLAGALGTHGICSVYGYQQAEEAWNMMRSFTGGRAIFSAPSSPYKGASAPLSVLHRAEDLWRERGVRAGTDIVFATAIAEAYAGDAYAELVARDDRGEDIHVYFGYELLEVRPDRYEAVFNVQKGQSLSQDVLSYDLIHVVPPMRPPAVIERSPLAYQAGPTRGYLEVNPDTLRHRRYANVYGVGDVIGVEAEKTGERARRQAEAVVRRIAETGVAS